MIKPINFINQQNVFIKSENSKHQNSYGQYDEKDFIESGKILTAQAILKQNNISFKNISLPKEITPLYTNEQYNKNYMDLSDIHVFEYPDTKVKLFINADKSILSDELQINEFLCFLDKNKQNLIKNKVLHNIIKNKLATDDDYSELNESNLGLMYKNTFDIETLDRIKNINNVFTNLKFTEEDLESAKINVKKELLSEEYLKSVQITKALYNDEDFKSDTEINNEIEQLTIEDLQKYYKENKDNACLEIYLTLPKTIFEQNKHKILSILHQDISGEYNKNNAEQGSDYKFNHNTKIIDGDKNAFYYPIKNENNKDSLLGQMTASLLNLKNRNWHASTQLFSNPIELKNGSELKHDNLFYSIEFDGDSYNNYSKNIENIVVSDIEEDLKRIKQNYKTRIENVFLNDFLIDIKNDELCAYNQEIFTLYDDIDSITSKDIKDFISLYLIKQQPIVTYRKG